MSRSAVQSLYCSLILAASWTCLLNDRISMIPFWISAGRSTIHLIAAARFAEGKFGSVAMVARCCKGMLRFVTFMEEGAEVYFACSLHDRCNVVKRFPNMSWLAASWYQVAKQRRPSSKFIATCWRAKGGPEELTECHCVRWLANLALTLLKEHKNTSRPVSPILCICNYFILRGWPLFTVSSPSYAERELPLRETI